MKARPPSFDRLDEKSRVGRLDDRRRPRLAAAVERLEPRELLTLAAVPIAASQGALFQGRVATFEQGDVMAGSILDDKATVDWGDGTSTSAGAITAGPGLDLLYRRIACVSR